MLLGTSYGRIFSSVFQPIMSVLNNKVSLYIFLKKRLALPGAGDECS